MTERDRDPGSTRTWHMPHRARHTFAIGGAGVAAFSAVSAAGRLPSFVPHAAGARTKAASAAQP